MMVELEKRILMNQYQSFRLGSSSIEKIVKWTILLTLLLSFFSLCSNGLFTKLFTIPGPQQILSLSVWGIHKGFIWQFFSYLFVQPILGEGISFSLLLHIFFDLYLLWSIGSAIVQMKGKKNFVGLYYGGGIFVGLIGYISLAIAGSSLPFAGATPAIYILLISWVFLFPEARIMLFLTIPMRAKWLVFGLIGVNLFLDFSNGNFFEFIITLSSLLYGYLYAVLVWETLSPFPRFHSIEQKLIYYKRKVIGQFQFDSLTATYAGSENAKVYDFKTGQAILDDETFMNACLKKISVHGIKGLSLRERWRMNRISKSRKNNSPGHTESF